MFLLKSVKEIVKNSKEIYFKKHFYEKAQERPISEKLIRESLKATMTVTYRQKEIYLSILLKGKDKEKEIMIPLSIDIGHQSTKTEKTTFALA